MKSRIDATHQLATEIVAICARRHSEGTLTAGDITAALKITERSLAIARETLYSTSREECLEPLSQVARH